MKPKRKRDFTGMFIMAVLLSFILPLGYLVVRIVSHGGTEEVRSREDYVLMLLQCLLGIAAIVLPLRLIRQKTLQIPRVMLVLYIAFLYCAIFLGEVRSFYYAVPHWDTILHTMSGAMLGALGFSMIAIFNNAERIPLNLSPMFIAAFGVLTLRLRWARCGKFNEFTMDSVFGTNMQKYMLDNGTALIGQAALQDTMKDIIVDAIGALVMSTIGYISLKYKKGWVEKLTIRFHVEKARKKTGKPKKGKGMNRA